MFITNNRFILTSEVNRITIAMLRPVARLYLAAAGMAEKVHGSRALSVLTFQLPNFGSQSEGACQGESRFLSHALPLRF